MPDSNKSYSQETLSLIDSLNEGFWDWWIKEDYEYMSPKFWKILGYDHKEMKSHPSEWQKLIHPDDLNIALGNFSKHVETKGQHSFDQEVRYFHREGHIVWIHCKGNVIDWDEEGQPVRMVGTHQDITQSKLIAQRDHVISVIREQFIKKRNNPNELFNFILDGMLEVTESEYGFFGPIIKVSNKDPYLKTLAITDIAWNEETKKFFDEHVLEGLEFFNLESLFGEVIKTGEPLLTNDAPGHPKATGIPSGHPPLERFMGVPFKKGSELFAMAGFANRKRGYDEDFYKFLQPLFDVVSDLIDDFLDSRKQDALRVEKELINKNMGICSWSYKISEDFIDFKIEEVSKLLGKKLVGLRQTFTKESMDELKNILLNLSDIEDEGEHVLVTKKSVGNFYVKVRFKKISDHQTNQEKVLGIAWNYTNEIELNQSLKDAKDKAEEVNRMKSIFLASISHEIRTPLNGIAGMVEFLEDTELKGTHNVLLSDLKSSTNILQTLVNDVLDLSKIEEGKLDLDEESFELNQVMNFLTSSMHYSTKEKNNILNLELSGIEGKVYKGDPNRIKQILLNYLSNANKFTTSGEIKLHCNVKEVKNGFEIIRMAVTDNGPGVPIAFQDQIFETFNQGVASTQKKFGGTGLGLAISKRLVELMGGTLGVESNGHSGSTFWLEIPLPVENKGISDLRKPAETTNLDLSHLKVLVAEDNIINQKVIRRFLEKFKINPTIVENGSLALEEVKGSEYDLIFMDLQMPVMDGIEASKKIRLLKDSKKRSFIVALTANVLKDDREKCFNAGMDDFLAKPIRKDLLRDLLSRFLK